MSKQPNTERENILDKLYPKAQVATMTVDLFEFEKLLKDYMKLKKEAKELKEAKLSVLEKPNQIENPDDNFKESVIDKPKEVQKATEVKPVVKDTKKSGSK